MLWTLLTIQDIRGELFYKLRHGMSWRGFPFIGPSIHCRLISEIRDGIERRLTWVVWVGVRKGDKYCSCPLAWLATNESLALIPWTRSDAVTYHRKRMFMLTALQYLAWTTRKLVALTCSAWCARYTSVDWRVKDGTCLLQYAHNCSSDIDTSEANAY